MRCWNLMRWDGMRRDTLDGMTETVEIGKDKRRGGLMPWVGRRPVGMRKDPTRRREEEGASRRMLQSRQRDFVERSTSICLPQWRACTADSPATYHFTSVPGAKASLNFTSTSLWIYGFVGPSSPSNYSITIDPLSAHPFSQSYSTQNTSSGSGSGSGRTLLYGTTGLRYAEHTVEITNWGSGVGLDLVVINAELGADE